MGKFATMFGEVVDGEYVLAPGSKPAVQAFKDQCDINSIMLKAARTGTLSHIAKYAQHYGDFSGFDYEAAQNQLAAARSMFYDLPPEVRSEFGNKPGAFISFVQTNTIEAVREKLPQLAAPGKQLPDVSGGKAAEAPAEAAPSPAPDGA